MSDENESNTPPSSKKAKVSERPKARNSLSRLSRSLDRSSYFSELASSSVRLQDLLSSSTRLQDLIDRTAGMQTITRPTERLLEQYQTSQSILEQSTRGLLESNSALFSQIERDNARLRSTISSLVPETSYVDRLTRELQKQTGSTSAIEAITRASLRHSAFLEQAQKLKSLVDPSSIRTNAALEALAQTPSFASESAKIASSLTSAFARGLADQPQSFEEAIDVIRSSVHEEIPDSQTSLVSFEGWLQLVFALLLFVYASYESDRSDEDILAAMDNLQTELAEKFDKLQLETLDTEKYYVAWNSVQIRSGPSTKHDKIAIVHPNQKVRLIKAKGNWLYVEYFDFLEEVPRTGWVYKRYLREIVLSVPD